MRKKSLLMRFFLHKLAKNAKICKRLSMSYPWIMQKMQKNLQKTLFEDMFIKHRQKCYTLHMLFSICYNFICCNLSNVVGMSFNKERMINCKSFGQVSKYQTQHQIFSFKVRQVNDKKVTTSKFSKMIKSAIALRKMKIFGPNLQR